MEYAQKVILELLNTMSQEELGKVLNTPQSNISAFANGKRGVSKSAKKILSEKYGYDIDKLNEKSISIKHSNIAHNLKRNVNKVSKHNKKAILEKKIKELEEKILILELENRHLNAQISVFEKTMEMFQELINKKLWTQK